MTSHSFHATFRRPSLRRYNLLSKPRRERLLKQVQVIDSHTGGEPTRTIIQGGPDLGTADLHIRRTLFDRDHQAFRRALVTEPRSSDAMVGALLCEPTRPDCITGVIFFNNAGSLGMCGHGTIGLIATLAYQGKISSGRHKIETPVGIVEATLNDDNTVTFDNVPSYRYAADVQLEVPGYGPVTGDIAWGGNWFFLVKHHPYTIDRAHLDQLTAFTWAIRQALAPNGIHGEGGAEIDHIELYGPGSSPAVNSRNFVLCPGKEYDRSPCGTGTSAKLACLYAEGLLAPGQVWRQESVIGSIFEGRVTAHNGHVIPSITGAAFITAESTIVLDPRDAFCWGFPA